MSHHTLILLNFEQAKNNLAIDFLDYSGAGDQLEIINRNLLIYSSKVGVEKNEVSDFLKSMPVDSFQVLLS